MRQLFRRGTLACLGTWALLSMGLPASPADPGSTSDILQKLRSFQSTGTVLYIAAHPDDENNRLLPYLALGRGLRTGYLSLTRGDGGQNLIGPELEDELGVIRTQELLAARREDGAQQFFSRARDFGFSKDSSDTLKRWDRQAVLADVVRVIREFRPDVIITRFSTVPGNTHGHHTASAVLALEAFRLAGDPKAFPDQLSTLSVWQPKRILWNSFSFGGPGGGDDAGAALQLDDGGYDPLLGYSYGEIAAIARDMHRTQGQGRAAVRGRQVETFELLAGEPAKTDILDGVDTTWNRVPGGVAIGGLTAALAAHFNPADPGASVPALLEIRRTLAGLGNDPLVVEKRRELDALLVACLGLFAETTVSRAEAVPGEPMTFKHTVIARNGVAVRWVGVRFPTLDRSVAWSTDLANNVSSSRESEATLPSTTALSQPYWLRKPGTAGMFEVDDPSLIGRPENPPAFPVEQRFEVGGQTLIVEDQPVQVISDPARGEFRRHLEVIPPVSIAWTDSLSLFAPGSTKTLQVSVTAARAHVEGRLALEAPSGWKVDPAAQVFSLPAVGSTATEAFTVTAPDRPDTARIEAEAHIGDATYSTGRKEISYEHIPPLLLQNPAELQAVSLHLSVHAKTVGYINGAGDEVANGLRRMGCAVTFLQPSDLTTENLRHYDAVVVGVRAFNTRSDLESRMDALFAYAKAGGNLIVQYNTFGQLKSSRFAPYDITLSELRVTHPEAPVTLLAPAHPGLAGPNRIDASDFEGWIQERARYIPRAWDSHFVPLLASNDPGEQPLDGLLLVADYGEGHVVYTGLSFFHELPAGVPGAYRLLANLVSLGR